MHVRWTPYPASCACQACLSPQRHVYIYIGQHVKFLSHFMLSVNSISIEFECGDFAIMASFEGTTKAEKLLVRLTNPAYLLAVN
jgi:hypothetical protein